jgi:hypothetical protein
VGSFDGLGFYRFGSAGRVAGLLIGIRGRAHVVGATQRGIFWRFGARIFVPFEGYFESVFGLRTGVKQIDLMMKVGMKDEIIPVRFRPNWVHGSVHFCRTGCISFVIAALDPERFPKAQGESFGELSTLALHGDNFYDSGSEKRQQLADS